MLPLLGQWREALFPGFVPRKRGWQASVLAATIVLVAIGESYAPTRFMPVAPVKAVYRLLATRPRGAVIELPLYSHQIQNPKSKI